MDGFERMIDEGQRFFAELAQNNSKAWFDSQKERYNAEIRKPAEFFGTLMAEDIARLTGVPVSTKLFRIYRDVRFSKDKTPLKTHQHILWRQAGAEGLAPAWFFGFSADYLLIGLGTMGLQKEGLARLRRLVDQDGAAMQDAIARSGARLSDWGPEPLKRVPKPYASDHPQAELLKRKSLVLHCDLPADWRDTGLVKSANRCVEALLPVFNRLQSAP